MTERTTTTTVEEGGHLPGGVCVHLMMLTVVPLVKGFFKKVVFQAIKKRKQDRHASLDSEMSLIQ